MDDLSFLQQAEQGILTVKVRDSVSNSTKVVVDGASSDIVERAAPTLYKRITRDADGLHQLFFNESAAVIICLLRFIYLDDYLASENLMGSPCSLLLHCQLYKLGLMFDMPQLVTLAIANAHREVELACSNPPMVLDLVDAIRFMYLELPDADALFRTVANYCVGCYLYHGLVESEEFRQTIFGAPDFLQLLLKTSMDRGFDAEGAQALINAEACDHRLHRSADPNIRAAARFTCHLHNESVVAGYEPPRDHWRQPTEYTLVHRPHFPTGMPTSEQVAIQLQSDEYELNPARWIGAPEIPSHWADAPRDSSDSNDALKAAAEHDDSTGMPATDRPETPEMPGTPSDRDYLWTYQDPVPPEYRRLAVVNYSEADMQTLEEIDASAARERKYQRMADESTARRIFPRGFPTPVQTPTLVRVPRPAPLVDVDVASSSAAAADPRGKGKARVRFALAADDDDDNVDGDWTLV